MFVAIEDGEEARLLRIRFPDGDVELRWTTDHPPVGVLVKSRGALWRVARHDGSGSIVLEPASVDDHANYGDGPVTKPSPLGDESVLLETIIEI